MEIKRGRDRIDREVPLVTFLIIFTLGYAVGGVSALMLIGLMLSGRDRARAPHRGVIRHDA